MSSPEARIPKFEDLEARIAAAVESVASTDPNPTDPFRGLYVTDDAAVATAKAQAPIDRDGRLGEASARLELDAIESAILALAAAPELHPPYARLFAYLHDDVTRKLPSAGLIARLLAGGRVSAEDVLARFGRDMPLRRSGAIRLIDERNQLPIVDRPVKVADALAALLLGAEIDERPLDNRLSRVELSEDQASRAEILAELRALLATDSQLPLVLTGPDAPSVLARAVRAPLLLIDAADLGDAEVMPVARLAAKLEGRRLAISGLEELSPEDRPAALRAMLAQPERPLICALSHAAVVALGDRTAVVVEIPLPSFAERQEAWRTFAGCEDVDDAAAKFRLSLSQIAEAAQVALQGAAVDGVPIPTAQHLDAGARRASSTRLGELASRLEPTFGWAELVLQEKPLETLKSISSYLRNRDLVLSEWGYAEKVGQNQGLKALFAGESGTGKTMSARVLSKELGLELYRIDLATIVSKYIGETEKNLDRIFGAAEGSNAILFFDEADALFGKRSDVSDAHDRYANIEVAYLLQKMEMYPGAVILATNFRHNIDDAFLRRLDFVVDFPFPEPDDREAIWRLLLPTEAPVADDLDLAFLAQQFKLSGGGIRNASMAGAFLAADDSRRITMEHLVVGVALEYAKLGRLTLETDFERFHDLVRPKGTPAA